MKLRLLGINGPFPESGGFTSGYLLETRGCLLQFDLGSGVLGALTAVTSPENLDALFISHWHFDHTADVPVLIYRLQALNRKLSVYGPADPDSSMFRLVCDSSCFSFTKVSSGDNIRLCGTEIRVCHARHPVPAVGFMVSSEEKSFGYTGDTNTLPSLSAEYRGCSLLLADGLFPREQWSVEKPHLSAELAACLAVESGAKRLIITHLNPLFPRSTLLEEARSVFPPARLADAGAVFDL